MSGSLRLSLSFIGSSLVLGSLTACPKGGDQPAVIVDAGAAGTLGGPDGLHGLTPSSAIGKLAPDAPILRVDGVVYTKQRLDQAMMQSALQAGIPPMMITGPARDGFEKPAYDKLIDRQLLIAEATKRKMLPTAEEAVTETKVDRERLIASLPPGKTFADALKELGTDEEQFNKELPNDVGISRLLKAVEASLATPTDDVLKKFYDENKPKMEVPETCTASHILIKLEEGATPEQVAAAEAKAKAIHAEVKGKPAAVFAKVAVEKSEDEQAKTSKGALGTFKRGELLPAIDAAAFALKKGEVSEPVRSQRGFHIVMSEGVTAARMRTFDEVKPLIIQREKTKLMMDAMEKLLADLKSKAKIERLVEPASGPFHNTPSDPMPLTPPPGMGGGAPPAGQMPAGPGAPAPH